MQALRPGAETALDAASLEAIAGDVPTAEMDREQVVGQTLVAIMTASGLQPSKAASKRMIAVSAVCSDCAVAPVQSVSRLQGQSTSIPLLKPPTVGSYHCLGPVALPALLQCICAGCTCAALQHCSSTSGLLNVFFWPAAGRRRQGQQRQGVQR